MNCLHSDIYEAKTLLKEVINIGGVSNKELSDAIGCSERTIQRWTQSGDGPGTSIKLSDFLKVCDALGVKVTVEKICKINDHDDKTYIRAWAHCKCLDD